MVQQLAVSLLTELQRNLGQEVESRFVLFARTEWHLDRAESTLLRDLSEMGEHAVLYATSESATTQKQRVQLQGVGSDRKDHDADQSVVAETVAQVNHQAFTARCTKLFDLALRAANGGEVELVSALRELRYTPEIVRFHWPYGDLQFEPGEEL